MLDRPADKENEIRSLKEADSESLGARWRSLFRKPFPDHLPRHLIIGLLTWQLQADRYGGLTKDEEKYLADVAARPGDAAIPRFGEREGGHQTGTVFVREHDGVLHRVTKTTQGFEWQGREYNSLSAVASAITGTRWNGLRFFGVSSSERKSRARA